MRDEFGYAYSPRQRNIPAPTLPYSRTVSLVKYYDPDLRIPNRPRPGATHRLARGAVAHSATANHGLDCACNDERIRKIREMLDGLSYVELSWLSQAVSRAAVFASHRSISQQVKTDIKLNEDRHRQGRRVFLEDGPSTQEQWTGRGDTGFEPECPLCNPNDWRRYVYG